MTGTGIEHLIRRAAEGDREAANRLAQECAEPVRRRLQHRLAGELRGRADTEDLLQSTLVAALGGLERFEYRGEGPFYAWLASVAEREFLMELRRARAAKRDIRRQRPIDAAAGRSAGLTSPSQGAVRGELAEDLRAAVASLPDRERQVVELHTFQGLGFAEVAETLGLSGKSAAYRIFERALKKVGLALDAGAGESAQE